MFTNSKFIFLSFIMDKWLRELNTTKQNGLQEAGASTSDTQTCSNTIDTETDSESLTTQLSQEETRVLKKNSTRNMFRLKWMDIPEFKSWLRPYYFENPILKKKTKISGEKAFCKICQKIIPAHRGDIYKHSKTDSHKRNSKCITSNKKIEEVINQSQAEPVRRAEIKLVVLMASLNLSFNIIDKLSEALPIIFTDSDIVKKISLHRTKATKLLQNVLGPHFLSELKLDLADNYFSIIVDETTYVSSRKQCAIVLVYCDEHFSVKTKFFQAVEIEDSTAKGLFDSVISCLVKNNVPLEYLVGYSSDTTNVMFGEFHSLVSLLKIQFPHIVCVKCSCHLIHLSTSHACLKLPRSVEDLLRNIGSHFSRSPKRQKSLEEFQKYFETDIHKILLPSTTRWLSLKACIDRVLEQYRPLKYYFIESLATDPSKTVEEVINTMNNSFTLIYLEFMSYVLELTNDFNLMFQKTSPLLYKLKPAVEKLVNVLCSNYMDTKCVKNNNMLKTDHTNPKQFIPLEKIYLGLAANSTLSDIDNDNLGSSEKATFLKTCLSFYIELVTQIKSRFPFKDEVFEIIQIVDPKIAQKGEIRTLGPLLKRFPFLKDGINPQCLDNEWKDHSLLKYDEYDLSSELPAEEYWGIVSKLKNAAGEIRFLNLKKIMKLLIVLPFSNASVERVFSTLKLIKTDHRNKMKSETLNALLLTSGAVSNPVTYEPSKSVLGYSKI